jgi:endonuclease YncB( thermonuclease family)
MTPSGSKFPARPWPGRVAAVLSALLFALPASAADRLPGPIPAQLVEVVDGDTVRVRAEVWLGQTIEVLVRIRGIDAPELRAQCPAERAGADAATAYLAATVGAGPLLLLDISDDKYFGRVVADVATADGAELGSAMLQSGLVRAYDGGTRASWCPEVASAGG